jgi:hypothetical protein
MFQKETSSFRNRTRKDAHGSLIKINHQIISKAIAFLFCVSFFVLLPAGFSGVSKAEAASYCVKATGSATKANATVINVAACTAAADAAAMPMTTFNASTFVAGETVYFTAGGGNFTTTMTLPSSGSSGVGNAITYQGIADGAANAYPTITLSANLINTNSKSYFTVDGFNLIHTGTGDSENGINYSGANSGVTLSHININMAGHGYAIASGGACTGPVLDHINVSGTGSSRNNIYFYGTGNTNGTFTNITTGDVGTQGIYLRNFAGLTVNGLTVTAGAVKGLFIDPASGTVNISNVNIQMTGGIAILISNMTNSANLNISNAVISGSNVQGLKISSVTGAINLDNLNIATSNNVAINFTGVVGSQGSYSNNITTSGSSVSGVMLTNVSGVDFSDIHTTVNGSYPVYITGSYNLSFTDVDSTAGGISAVFLINASHDISLNHCSINGGATFNVNGASYNVTFNNCTAENNLFSGFRVEESSHHITFRNCIAQGNQLTGFRVVDDSHDINYYNCRSDYNLHNGFDTTVGSSLLSPRDLNYWQCEASYNGTINTTSDGGGFIPHDASTNINNYNCISHHNYTLGIGAVGTSTGGFYNCSVYANGYAIGDSFNGSTVTIASNRGNVYFADPNTGFIVKNTISSGGKPWEAFDSGVKVIGVLDYNLYLPLDNSKFVSYDGTNNVSWSVYKGTYEAHSYNYNPLFNNSNANDFTLQSVSPAIDSGTPISGLTTDYLNNHIYGTPDIGAYEYQPPYTIGTDNPNISSPIRIYADGKYRYTNTVSGSSVAKLSIIPQAGFGTGDYSQWMDVTVNTWHSTGDYYKSWTETTSNSALVTNHTIGDLKPNTYYTLKLDTINQTTYLSNGTGQLTFTYSGGYSTNHTFELNEDTTSPTNIALSSITPDSSTQLTITAQTATDSESGLSSTPYWFQETSHNAGALSSTDWQASTNFINTGLSPNTQYSYQVKTKDANNNESTYSTTLSKYTLAPTPTTLTISSLPLTTTLSTDIFPNSTANQSGYLFTNTTNSHTSNWIQSNTWQDTNLNCNTTYTYTLKYRNADGTETDPITVSKSTTGCGTPFASPIKPDVSNTKITTTNSGPITIDNLPDTITQLAVSTTQDFKNSSWQDIKDLQTILSKYINTIKLYFKFKTKDGGVSDTIIYTPNNGNGSNTTSGNATSNTPANTITLTEGDIVKTPTNPDVYIIKYKNNKQYKRLILSPNVFKSYQHLKWTNLKIISQDQLNEYTTSSLVQLSGDNNIYSLTPYGDEGERRIQSTIQPYDQDSVYEINKVDRDSYKLIKLK